eukprot:3221816-Pyramimonas_sp.AAC.1
MASPWREMFWMRIEDGAAEKRRRLEDAAHALEDDPHGAQGNGDSYELMGWMGSRMHICAGPEVRRGSMAWPASTGSSTIEAKGQDDAPTTPTTEMIKAKGVATPTTPTTEMIKAKVATPTTAGTDFKGDVAADVIEIVSSADEIESPDGL